MSKKRKSQKGNRRAKFLFNSPGEETNVNTKPQVIKNKKKSLNRRNTKQKLSKGDFNEGSGYE